MGSERRLSCPSARSVRPRRMPVSRWSQLRAVVHDRHVGRTSRRRMTAGQGGPGTASRAAPGRAAPRAGTRRPPPGWNAPPRAGARHRSSPTGTRRRRRPGTARRPRRLERPVTVRAGLGCLHRLAGAERDLRGGHVPQLGHHRAQSCSAARGAPTPAPTAAPRLRRAEAGAKIGVVVGLVFAAVYGLFVWFAWRGQNWARIVLWVLGGLGLLGGLVGSGGGRLAAALPHRAELLPGAPAARGDRAPGAQAVERLVPLPALAARHRSGALRPGTRPRPSFSCWSAATAPRPPSSSTAGR